MSLVTQTETLAGHFFRYITWYWGAQSVQENILQTIRPAAAWTVHTRQAGSMLSCCLCQILTLPSEYSSRQRASSDQATLFQPYDVQFWWACVLSWPGWHLVWSSAVVALSYCCTNWRVFVPNCKGVCLYRFPLSQVTMVLSSKSNFLFLGQEEKFLHPAGLLPAPATSN